ncbi:MAG: type II secretion system F family protein [bacterium]|nr:type II secretion system F family protein [bacterium]
MPRYAYIITDAEGVRREDVIRAPSQHAAMNALTKRGARIISLKEIKTLEVERLSVAEEIQLQIYKWRTHVPLKTVVFFTRQLSTMFSAGLTIERSISNLMVEEKNTKFRKVLAEIANDIKKGMSLSEALAQHPGVFDGLYVATVRAGEVSGSLHVALEQLSDYLEATAETRRKVVSALTYPILAIVFMIFIVTVLVVFVVPQFAEVYAKFGAGLPGPTRLLVNIAQLLSQNFLPVTGIVIAIIVAIWIISKTERGAFVIDSIKLKIPVFGALIEYSIMNKFARTFGILMGAGVPVLESFNQVQRVVNNEVIGRGIVAIKKMVKDGFAISIALKKSGVFPATLVQLVQTGEETGEMDKLLEKAAYFYEKQVDAMVERMTSLIEPMLIIILGGVVTAILVSVYLPVFKLGRAIGRM